jgi:hypothetical protein
MDTTKRGGRGGVVKEGHGEDRVNLHIYILIEVFMK